MKFNSSGLRKQAHSSCGNQHVWWRQMDRIRTLAWIGSLLSLTVLVSGCDVFLASFTDDTIGSPPAPTQSSGTVSLDTGAGTVVVVAAPPGLPAKKWVRINHPTALTPQTAMRGDFSQFDGIGRYSLTANMYIPSGTGVVTVQFEPFAQGPRNYANFMHLDFMPEGDIRVDDGPIRFGHFPRDKMFTLHADLTITATDATVVVSLTGGGASGSRTLTVDPSLLNAAHLFGAVRFWMGFQHKGLFYVDDIVVLRTDE